MPTNLPHYYSSIDSFRGLATVMACLFHFVCTTTNYITNANVLQLFSFGEYGVYALFVISGIVIPLTMLNSNYLSNNYTTPLQQLIVISSGFLVAIIAAFFLFRCRKPCPTIIQKH